MLRLLLLLLGTTTARRFWFLLVAGGLACAAGGLALFIDALDGVLHFPIHAFGWVLGAIGLITLFASSASAGMQRTLRIARGLGLIALAVLVVDHHKADVVVMAMAFGLAYAVDGIFRIAASAVVRFPGWGKAMAVGFGEMLVAAFFFEPYPTHYAGTLPYCLGLLLFLSGVAATRLGAELRALPPRRTLPLLLSGSTDLAVDDDGRDSTDRMGTLTVHVWTPTGSVENAQHMLIVDRYIAAMDAQGVISTGHAALEAPPDIYVSHYPAVEIDRSPDDFAHTLLATQENDVPAKFQPSYAEESAGWCESTEKVVFEGVDVARLRAFWAVYRKDNVYNLTRRNCSTSTVLALETALEGWMARRGITFALFLRILFSPELWVASQLRKRAESMAWTPGLVLDYARALFGAINPPAHSWLGQASYAQAVGRDARRREKETLARHEATEKSRGSKAPPSQEVSPHAPGARRALSTAAVIASASIFGLTYGLSAPLIAKDLAHRGRGELFIGLNAAMHAVGVLGIAPFLPQLAARFGSRRLILFALGASAALLAAFPIVPSIWFWFLFRLGLGVAAETLFVMSETWANDLSDDKTRGRIMAIYTAALSLGFAGGPAILSVVHSSRTAYFLGASLALFAMIPLAHRALIAPSKIEHAPVRTVFYARLAPIAMGTALLNAAVETAGLSFVALYAVGLGFTEQNALRLVSTLLVGAIVMQLPIGLLADKVSPRKLLIGLAVLSTAGALAWPLMLQNQTLAFATVFVWGGLFVGIYTVMLSMVGSRFKGAELVGIYSVMSVAWGAGALIGPALVGVAMSSSPKFGLPYAIALTCALFVVLVITRKSRSS